MESIVPLDKIEKDPRNLAYFYPRMPVTKYAKMTNEYFFWRMVQVAEAVAKLEGKLLIPASCIHWERKKKLSERMVSVFKQSFYLMTAAELTKNEKKKYEGLNTGEVFAV
jgi:hypothetical protein